jgi:hypothetical protein
MPGTEPHPSGGAKPTVLIIAFTDLSTDPRVYRQIIALQADYDVIAAGLKDPDVPGVNFVPLQWKRRPRSQRFAGAMRLLLRRHSAHYWSNPSIQFALRQLSATRPSLVIANDIDALPLALRVADTAPVVFDSHEYWPGRHGKGIFAPLHASYRRNLCAKYIPAASDMMTVSPGIAEEYFKDTGVRSVVVTNAPPYEPDLAPGVVQADTLRIVHHGAALRGRHLELMCDMMDLLDDRFTLTFILTDRDREYLAELKSRAAANPRIEFRPPVPMREISKFLNEFDIGAYILPPGSFNQKFALPNKLFEFIQARLAIAIGPSPEMARIVSANNLGVVADSFEPASLAARLNALSAADIAQFKANSHAVACEFSAEGNASALRSMVSNALSENAGDAN